MSISSTTNEPRKMVTGSWERPATIERNNFVHKSLSCWSYNIAVGCNHACRFCYVPDASTNKLARQLGPKGVADPDEQWGDYVFVRQWNGPAFLRSLEKAEALPATDLNADGNRAVMMCTTTDPYQVVSGPRAGFLNCELEQLMNAALHLILERSTLNVRILTRSPLAKRHFDIMRKFGKRLLFGMSLPTLNNQLAKIYEPKAPAPTKRLEALHAARAAGLNVFVAVAPVYPECDEHDMERTLRAVKELDPVTVFMEPINIRAENVARTEKHAQALGFSLAHKGVFASPEKWRHYAVLQMHIFENLCSKLGLRERMHLWPDKSLGSLAAIEQLSADDSPGSSLAVPYEQWLQQHWNKISAWPK